MPIEISVVQAASLGVLLASVLFLLFLLVAGWRIARRAIRFAGRFKSMAAERVNGIVQVKGVFDEPPEPRRAPARASSQPSKFGALLKEATDFTPSPEDLARTAALEPVKPDKVKLS